jgi:hypothetical protein
MDYDLRNNGTASARTNVAGLGSADPWLGADSLYSGTYYVDSIPVTVVAKDLGMTLNINSMNQASLEAFFNFVLGDAKTADQLTNAILDWRDADDQARPNGAEVDDYVKAGLLTLPSNGPFREVDDLINVYGMTPDVLAQIRPFLTTHGATTGTTAVKVNLNSAPEEVLRALPGMTDQIINSILAGRSQGRRITSAAQVTGGGGAAGGRGGAAGGGRGGAAGGRTGAAAAQAAATQNNLTTTTTVDTTNVELDIYVQNSANAEPTRLTAIVTRTNNMATITWQQW